MRARLPQAPYGAERSFWRAAQRTVRASGGVVFSPEWRSRIFHLEDERLTIRLSLLEACSCERAAVSSTVSSELDSNQHFSLRVGHLLAGEERRGRSSRAAAIGAAMERAVASAELSVTWRGQRELVWPSTSVKGPEVRRRKELFARVRKPRDYRPKDERLTIRPRAEMSTSDERGIRRGRLGWIRTSNSQNQCV